MRKGTIEKQTISFLSVVAQLVHAGGTLVQGTPAESEPSSRQASKSAIAQCLTAFAVSSQGTGG